MRTDRLRGLIPWLLFLLTFAAFVPILRNGFVNLDDHVNLLRNPQFGRLYWQRLLWMLTPAHQEHFQPLSWLSLALDYALWGINPVGYHLTSLLLHCANAVLFYFIGARLIAASGAKVDAAAAAALAALLFCLHPLRVESVAWATERRDVLSGFFYLLAVLGYLRGRLGWALGAFLLSLLSKVMGVTLPIALLLLDVYPLQRLAADPRRWTTPQALKILREKIPFLVLSCAAAAVAVATHLQSDKLPSLEQYTLVRRLCVAAYGLMFYLWKSLLPMNLFAFYPMPQPFHAYAGRFALCALLALALSVLLIARRRSSPAALAAWLYYAVTLLPVLGLFGYLPHLGADRYSYLSCLGWALVGAVWLLQGGRLRLAAAAALLPLLSLLTCRQALVWKDTQSLWEHMASDPKHWVAHNALGLFALERGERARAAAYFEASLAGNPTSGMAHNNLGNLKSSLGLQEEALKHYRAALRLSPGHFAIHYNIASVLAVQGKWREAVLEYQEELKIDPSSERVQKALAAARAKARTRAP